jgi:hypothetical protein
MYIVVSLYFHDKFNNVLFLLKRAQKCKFIQKLKIPTKTHWVKIRKLT